MQRNGLQKEQGGGAKGGASFHNVNIDM